MHKLGSLVMAVALGAAILMSAGAPYAMAERHLEINRTPAAEVIKTHMKQDAMSEALGQPSMPTTMSLASRAERSHSERATPA